MCFRMFLILGYFAYFIGAMIYCFGDEGSIRLLVVTTVVISCYAMHVIKNQCGSRVEAIMNNTSKNHNFPSERTRHILKR